jgi:ribosomal-protein-serine acetyltransferase
VIAFQSLIRAAISSARWCSLNTHHTSRRNEGIQPGVSLAACHLRPYEPDDASALWEAARESVAEVFPWLEWCHAEYSMAEAVEWTRSRGRLAAEGQEYSFAIVGDDGRFLGGCGINQISRIHKLGNLGYWLRTSATGRGVATEAVRQAADFAFQKTDLVRLEIVCALGNERSQRVALRAGAVREGILRRRLLIHGHSVDAVMHSLVRS